MASYDISFDKKLDTWKNRLLDLSKRNRLINYRDTQRGGLRLLSPTINELWSQLVLNEKPISFPLPPARGEVAELPEGAIRTNQVPAEQQRTLKNLRSKSRSFLEEQGVNALYLGFGLLNWTEQGARTQTQAAPLVLVPVSLAVEDITSPYHLLPLDEEPVVNPTLSYLLNRDYGIELPECDFEKNIATYLRKVKVAVEETGWTVDEVAVLSLFSFQKIKMYDDLETNREQILAPGLAKQAKKTTLFIHTSESKRGGSRSLAVGRLVVLPKMETSVLLGMQKRKDDNFLGILADEVTNCVVLYPRFVYCHSKAICRPKIDRLKTRVALESINDELNGFNETLCRVWSAEDVQDVGDRIIEALPSRGGNDNSIGHICSECQQSSHQHRRSHLAEPQQSLRPSLGFPPQTAPAQIGRNPKRSSRRRQNRWKYARKRGRLQRDRRRQDRLEFLYSIPVETWTPLPQVVGTHCTPIERRPSYGNSYR